MNVSKIKITNTLNRFNYKEFIKKSLFVNLSSLTTYVIYPISTTSSNSSIKSDVEIMNDILSFEHKTIAVFKTSTNLLSKSHVKKVLENHENHRDTLDATIRKLRGKPVGAGDYNITTIANDYAVKEIDSDTGKLELFVKLEISLTKIYLAGVTNATDKDVIKYLCNFASETSVNNITLGGEPQKYFM